LQKLQKLQEARERFYGEEDPVTGKKLYRPEVSLRSCLPRSS